MKHLLALAFFLLTTFAANAQIRLARLFSDHVVLQRQQPIPVWGWAKPGETVRVMLAGQTAQAKAGVDGKWTVRLAPLEAGGPHSLSVVGKSGQVVVDDVLIGEVWLCSGQSNMEWPVKAADNFLTEKADANVPTIRHFFVEHDLALTPQTDLKTGDWKVCSPETVGDFTAVGFFFAREVARKLNVPVGLLHSSWGGSQAEGWISREAMLTNPELAPTVQQMPTSWAQVDSLMDVRLSRQLTGKPTRPTLAEEQTYLTANYDISRWRASDPFGQWDWKGMNGFRGQGYMARTVELPAGMADNPTTLGLAHHDGPTQVYINGKRVWEGSLSGNRAIPIPANTWQTGKNQLMVKMGNARTPEWFGLGLEGSASDLYVGNESGRVSLANGWRIMPALAEPHTYTRFMNNLATGLYNGMIHPLVPFGIRGALWYQGETNAGRAYQYRQTFPLLIQNWRTLWSQAGSAANFPFYFVQLSSFGSNQNSNQGSDWAELREAQTLTLSLPNTGMAITTDIGNAQDIHPTNKQDVGHRLALVALKQTYNQPIGEGSPLFDKATFADGRAVVSFRNAPNGLTIKDRYNYLKGFEIAGEDRVFHYAQAHVEGNTVVVSHPKVSKPVAVRYAWSNAPVEANLFSTEGLPVGPFRSDAWPGVTEKARFE
jgi:sialate O-acetylesterase